MRNPSRWIDLIVLAALLLAGCGTTTPAPSPTATPEPSPTATPEPSPTPTPENIGEARIRYIMADIYLGAPLEYYAWFPEDAEAMESVSRVRQGYLIQNLAAFERKLVNDQWQVVYAGTDATIYGMDVILVEPTLDTSSIQGIRTAEFDGAGNVVIKDGLGNVISTIWVGYSQGLASFSPDGKYLLADGHYSDYAVDVKLIDLRTSTTYTLPFPIEPYNYGYTFSPNSDKLLYEYGSAEGWIYEIIDLHDMSRVDLLRGYEINTSPIWAPDGTYLVFMGWPIGTSYMNARVHRIDANSGSLSTFSEIHNLYGLNWLDNQHAVLTAIIPGDASQIVVYALDFSRTTAEILIDEWIDQFKICKPRQDGDLLACVRHSSDTTEDIFLYEIQTGRIIDVAPLPYVPATSAGSRGGAALSRPGSYDFDWSPGGDQLLFSNPKSFNETSYLYNLQSGQLTQISGAHPHWIDEETYSVWVISGGYYYSIYSLDYGLVGNFCGPGAISCNFMIPPSTGTSQPINTGESRIRYILADAQLGNVIEYYRACPDPECIEAVRRWDAGIRVTNLDEFERRLLPELGWLVVYAGTQNAADGMDILLTGQSSGCNHPYWPVMVGATWTYDILNMMGNSEGTETWEITSVSNDPDGVRFTVYKASPYGSGDSTYLCTPEGTIHQEGSNTFDILLPPTDEFVPNNTWPAMSGSSLLFVGMQQQSVPAGTFTTARFSLLPNGYVDFYWAEGVGLVAMRSDLSRVLTSYSIPTGDGIPAESVGEATIRAGIAYPSEGDLPIPGDIYLFIRNAADGSEYSSSWTGEYVGFISVPAPGLYTAYAQVIRTFDPTPLRFLYGTTCSNQQQINVYPGDNIDITLIFCP